MKRKEAQEKIVAYYEQQLACAASEGYDSANSQLHYAEPNSNPKFVFSQRTPDGRKFNLVIGMAKTGPKNWLLDGRGRISPTDDSVSRGVVNFDTAFYNDDVEPLVAEIEQRYRDYWRRKLSEVKTPVSNAPAMQRPQPQPEIQYMAGLDDEKYFLSTDESYRLIKLVAKDGDPVLLGLLNRMFPTISPTDMAEFRRILQKAKE